MSGNRSYIVKDSNDNFVESLVYDDMKDWKNDITVKQTGTIRIMTFNVHGFTDREKKTSIRDILDVIKQINPDLMAIEEFVFHGVKRQITYIDFKKFLQGLGFVVITTDRLQNNVLASKIDCEIIPTLDLGKDPFHNVLRFANILKIKSKTIGSESDLLFIGTHLDVFDESGQTRLKQAKIILDAIEDIRTSLVMQKKNHNLMIIVAGDFNCIRPADYTDLEWDFICRIDADRGLDTERMKSSTKTMKGSTKTMKSSTKTLKDSAEIMTLKKDAVLLFEENDIIDASVQLDVPINLSVWANRRVDYICGQNVTFLLSSTVRNACSDHYPVYADIDIDI